jgi:peptidoglycan/xylan/chitin deacetylase (PgdA/CDA1 family)
MGLTKANMKKPEVKIEVIEPSYKIEFSFDDGGILDLKIAELLKKYHFTATFYPVLDWIGKQGFLSWNHLGELDKNGFKVGSHTISHPQDLKALFDEDLHLEIQNSKDMIETALGHSISSFCYPRGRYDERVRDKVVNAGYVEARTTGAPGITIIKDKYALPGTIHIFQRPEYGSQSILEFATNTLERLKREGGYCNIWAHSAEIERDGNWEVLEKILIAVTQL